MILRKLIFDAMGDDPCLGYMTACNRILEAPEHAFLVRKYRGADAPKEEVT